MSSTKLVTTRSRVWAPAAAGALGLLLSLPLPASAQYFGRNKVQYESRDFLELSTQNWTIYFYAEEAEAIEDIARMAERWYERFSRSFQHDFETRKPLVIYADHPDFQQTNTLQGAIGQGTGGVTESLKNRVIMPLTASYRETDRILGHELVHAFQFNVAQNRLQGGFVNLVRLPLWLVEGMAEYMSMGRDHPHTAMWLRDHILRDDKPTLKEITRDPKYFAYRFGQAFLSFIGGTYGDDAAQDYFRTALRRGWEPAVEHVFDMPADSLSAHWWEMIEREYRPLMAGRTKPYETGDVLLCEECGAGRANVAPSLSPDGRYIVFQSEKDLFSMDLFLADVATGRILRPLRRNETAYIDGIRYIDSSGSWSPDSRKLAFVVFAEGNNQLAIMDVRSGRLEERIEIEGLGAIQNPAWSPDGRRIAFTGLRGGITDLYIHDFETGSVQQITNDKHADLQPAWSPDGRTLVFASDRSEETDFESLTFGNYVLSFLDLETLKVAPLSVFDGAKHVNPVYDRTGEGVFFVSDADGFSDIYHLRLADGEMRRITRAVTGVSGITATSPAFSYSPRTDLLAFSVFHERGYIVNTAYPDDMSTFADVVADAGGRRGRLLPPGRPAFRSRVATYLSDPYMGLVGDSIYLAETAEPYDPSLQLDYIGQPTIGVGADPYSGYVTGGTTATFSDMLGNRFLGVQLLANGTFRDIGGVVYYMNQKRRWNWGAGAQHIPILYRYANYNTPGQLDIENARLIIDAAVGTAAFPLSATRRVEGSLGFTRYGYHRELETVYFNRFGQAVDYTRRKIDSPEPLNLASASVAFVGDNSYAAFTSPVRGQRFRLEAETTYGTVNFNTLTMDYRRYFNNGGPLTLATRALHMGRYGDFTGVEDRMYPLYLGWETFIRGYSYNSFNFNRECTVTAQSNCLETERLLGHRVGVLNAEFRLPLTGVEEFGLINFPYLPIELTAFTDVGVAWDRERPADLKWSTTDTGRIPVASSGFSLRFNILGAMILEWYHAYAWQRPLAGGWVSGFHLAPGW